MNLETYETRSVEMPKYIADCAAAMWGDCASISFALDMASICEVPYFIHMPFSDCAKEMAKETERTHTAVSFTAEQWKTCERIAASFNVSVGNFIAGCHALAHVVYHNGYLPSSDQVEVYTRTLKANGPCL